MFQPNISPKTLAQSQRTFDTYVITTSPWIVKCAHEVAIKHLNRLKILSNCFSLAAVERPDLNGSQYWSHCVSLISASIRRETDGPMNKFDKLCGMPPFLRDDEVNFVAEGMMKAAVIAVKDGRMAKNNMLDMVGMEEVESRSMQKAHSIVQADHNKSPASERVGTREFRMRVLQLQQAFTYEMISRAKREGRWKDKWTSVKREVETIKSGLAEAYSSRLRNLGNMGNDDTGEIQAITTLRNAQLKAGGDYERLVREHMIKVKATRPQVGWRKREEMEGQMLGNMKGQWETFRKQFDEVRSRYEELRKSGKGGGGKEKEEEEGGQMWKKEEIEKEIEFQMGEYWSRQENAIEEMEIGTEQEFKNHNDLPLARIKRIMKSDEDVRMISAEAPVLFAKACEMFILELTLKSWCHSQGMKRRTVQREDIQNAVKGTDVLDFLVEILNPGEGGGEEYPGMYQVVESEGGGGAGAPMNIDEAEVIPPVKAEGKDDGMEEGEFYVGKTGEITRVKTEAKPGGTL